MVANHGWTVGLIVQWLSRQLYTLKVAGSIPAGVSFQFFGFFFLTICLHNHFCIHLRSSNGFDPLGGNCPIDCGICILANKFGSCCCASEKLKNLKEILFDFKKKITNECEWRTSFRSLCVSSITICGCAISAKTNKKKRKTTTMLLRIDMDKDVFAIGRSESSKFFNLNSFTNVQKIKICMEKQ